MSENITHISFTEDCFQFMLSLSKFCPEFKQAGQSYVRLARLTSVNRGGDRFSVTLLDQVREAYRNKVARFITDADFYDRTEAIL